MQATLARCAFVMQVRPDTIEGVLGKTYDSQVCSIARALEVVGERWSLLIIRDALFASSSRYGDFQRSLGVATNILSDRLDGFVESGLMQKRRYSDQPELYEYVLTEKGRDLAPALVALSDWGDRWCSPDGPPVLFKHAECGGRVHHSLECAGCGRVDDAAQVATQPGPGRPKRPR
jgi:DNA-binding HxlR family transcriptional regulator